MGHLYAERRALLSALTERVQVLYSTRVHTKQLILEHKHLNILATPMFNFEEDEVLKSRDLEYNVRLNTITLEAHQPQPSH